MPYRKSIYDTNYRYRQAVVAVSQKIDSGLSDDRIATELASEYLERETTDLARKIREVRKMPEMRILRRWLIGSVWYLLLFKLIVTGIIILDPDITIGFSVLLLILALILPVVALVLLYKETPLAYMTTMLFLILPGAGLVGHLVEGFLWAAAPFVIRGLCLATLAIYIVAIVVSWYLDRRRPTEILRVNRTLVQINQ